MNTRETPESAADTAQPANGSVQRIVRNSTLNLIGQGFLAVFYLVVVFILARTLGKDGLGAYYTFFALILVVQWVGEAGVGTVLTCRIAQQPQHWRVIVAEATGLFTVITLLSAGVFLVIGGGVAWYRRDADLWFWSAAAGIACGGIQVNRFCGGVLRAFERVGDENFARFLQGALFVLFVVALVLNDSVSVGMVLAMFAASHVAASSYLLHRLARQYGLGWRLNRHVVKDWLTEAVPLGFADVVRHLTWQLDTLLLGLLRPPAVVGIYSVAYRPLGPLNWLPQAVLSAMFPAVARMAGGDRAALSRTFSHSLRLMWIASLPLAVAICICAEPLILVLAGRDYLEAAVPMRVLIWIAILSFLSFPFRFVFTAVGKQKLFAWLVVGVFVLELVVELSLIPHFGYMGACTGSVIGELIFTVTGLAICARLGIGTLAVRPMASAVAAALVMGAVLWPARDGSWVVLGFIAILSGLLYLVLCILLGALKWDEVICFRDSLLGLARLLPGRAARSATATDEPATNGIASASVFQGACAAPTVCPSRPETAPERSRAHGRHVGLIREARDWMQQLRSEAFAPPPPLTAADVAHVLGEPVRSCELWRANWRNRVYRVELTGDRWLVAKQMCVPAPGQASRECEQLDQLARLRIPQLTVPRPGALLPAHRAYLMELVPGQTLQDVFWDPARSADLPHACALVGRVLGQLHQEWTESVGRVPVEELADDLAQMPGGFSAGQWETIQRALDNLASQETAVGHLYLDFKADNILYHRDTLALIDPPPEFRQGVLLWDYATFRSSLAWQLWKVLATRCSRHCHRLVRESLLGFEQAYFAGTSSWRTGPQTSSLLVSLLELQQVGQLLVFQVGKLRLARRRRNPLMLGGHFLWEVTSTIAWLPALQVRKHSLLRRIRQQLAEGADGLGQMRNARPDTVSRPCPSIG